MPADGIRLISHLDILTYDEIIGFVKTAVEFGVNKVRITGGEPLVRKGITTLLRELALIPGIDDLSMTTNGVLLKTFAQELKDSGLQRVNVSLDTLDPEKFRNMTRGGDVTAVIAGIDEAIKVGLDPVKLNCVISSSPNEADAIAVKAFAVSRGIEVRYIHEMDLDSGYFKPVIGGDGGNCASCNRLRLTANGLVKPCLFSNSGYSVRDLGPKRALELALQNKPECGTINTTGEFYNLGG
jgi:cyclic pyranopterin phosphate synthase